MYETLKAATTPSESALCLLELVRSTWTVAWLREVVSRDIPGMLRNGPQRIGRLAEAADAKPRTLYRVMRALAGIGLFKELHGRRFALTATGRLLCADDPLSQRDGLLMTGKEFYQRLFQRIPQVLTSGISGFELEYGEPLFRHAGKEPAMAEAIDNAMTCLSNAYLFSILAAYRFDNVATLVDLGCGRGRFAVSLLGRVPSIKKATLLDLPHVIEAARATAIRAGVEARCEFSGVSYFDKHAIPAGADVYLLKHNAHDHSDKDVLRLLGNVRLALGPHSRALLIDGVMPPPNKYSMVHGMDLAGLALLPASSQERTYDQWFELIAASGLAVLNTIPTTSDVSIIEMVAARRFTRFASSGSRGPR